MNAKRFNRKIQIFFGLKLKEIKHNLYLFLHSEIAIVMMIALCFYIAGLLTVIPIQLFTRGFNDPPLYLYTLKCLVIGVLVLTILAIVGVFCMTVYVAAKSFCRWIAGNWSEAENLLCNEEKRGERKI